MDEAGRKSRRQRRRFYRRRRVWVAAGVVVALLVLVGPWPTYRSHFAGSGYAEATFARIDRVDLSGRRGPLRAGVSVVDITPPVGEPMAGYSARDPKASRGVLDRTWAKALSLTSGHKTVTIVAGGVLLVSPELRQAILARCRLPAEEVYFTATHTHTGGGGYSPQWAWEYVLGEFDEKILDRLAGAFAGAIARSRADMQPALIRIAQIREDAALDALLVNRLLKSPGQGSLSGVYLLRPGGEPLACLVVLGAHPTSLDRQDRRISGDFPGVVQREVERLTGAATLFAQGGVGSMRPAIDRTSDAAAFTRVGVKIAAMAAAGFDDGEAADTVELSAAIVEVDLPAQQYRISEHLRLSPLAVSLVHERRTYIHAVRINEAVLLGMPGDFSGELTVELERLCAEMPVTPIVTSFNGDYIGYLVPARHYGTGSYEVRGMNFFGPWCGEYFVELSRRIITRMAVSAREGAGSRPTSR